MAESGCSRTLVREWETLRDATRVRGECVTAHEIYTAIPERGLATPARSRHTRKRDGAGASVAWGKGLETDIPWTACLESSASVNPHTRMRRLTPLPRKRGRSRLSRGVKGLVRAETRL